MNFKITDKNVRVHGRYRNLDNGIDVSWVNSGIEFRFIGTQLRFTVKSQSTELRKPAYLQVFVDGERTKRIRTSLGEYEYIAAGKLPEGEHTAKILLVSETQWNPLVFLSLEIDGELLPPPEVPEGQLKFDFYGDSLTCGVGTIPGWEDYDTDNQDSTLAHAYRVVEHFHGDGQFISVSGWGVMRGYNGDEPANIPRIFDCLTMATEEKYDVTGRDADFIGVLLGTNDMANPIEHDVLRDAYVSFFRKLRAANSRATILCAGKEKPAEMIEDAIELLKGEDDNIVQVWIPDSNYDLHPEYHGSYNHPSGEWGRDVAACFYPVIERLLKKRQG